MVSSLIKSSSITADRFDHVSWAGLGLCWVGLDWAGLCWVGFGLTADRFGFVLGWTGLGWVCVGLGLCWVGLDWAGLG